MGFKKDIKEEINEARKSLEDLEKQSFAYEMLSDQRKQNKRIFAIWIITFVAFIGLLGYTIYLLNDFTVVETTEEKYDITQDSGDGGNNNFVNGNGNEVNNG